MMKRLFPTALAVLLLLLAGCTAKPDTSNQSKPTDYYLTDTDLPLDDAARLRAAPDFLDLISGVHELVGQFLGHLARKGVRVFQIVEVRRSCDDDAQVPVPRFGLAEELGHLGIQFRREASGDGGHVHGRRGMRLAGAAQENRARREQAERERERMH